MIKVKKTMKNFWQDNSGLSISMETVAYAIAAISVAGILAGIGITAAKNKAAGISGDLQSFKVNGPADGTIGTGSTGTDATVTDGNHAITGIDIED